MSENEFSMPDMDRSSVDKSFGDITRPHGAMPDLDIDFMTLTRDDAAFERYLENAPSIVTALDTQNALKDVVWSNEKELTTVMDQLVRDLTRRARADLLIGELVIISGTTLVLPQGEKNDIREGVSFYPRNIESDEFVPQLITGQSGRFYSFYYRIVENPNNTYSARIVYRVSVGESDTPFQHTFVCASADVDYTTRLEFDKDEINRDVRDAKDVFKEVMSVEVSEYLSQLYELMGSSDGRYTAEMLNTISSIVQIISTHDALKSVRQRSLESLETLIISYMSPRLGGRPLAIEYTAGLLHSSDGKIEPKSLIPQWQQSEDAPFTLEATVITEVAVRPIHDNTSNAQEPYMIIRLGDDTHYVPLSKITAIL
ncbi:MAG: hypothetical protein ABIQ04_01725 [Candidatus Saccharimonadales bacterium]